MERSSTITDLLAAAEQGDERAWGEIVEEFTNLVWSVCRSFRLADEQALDVIQTTWLRLVENLGRIREPERLAGWLATTARNECLRTLRRRGREDVGWAETTVDNVLDDPALGGGEFYEAAVDARLLNDERDAHLWSCFVRLPERCQRLLRVLMATEPPAYTEVSEALGLPVGSIGPTRQRCLARLRRLTAEVGS